MFPSKIPRALFAMPTLGELEAPVARRRLYIAAGIACFIIAWVLLGVRSLAQEKLLGFPNANGLGYYMYLPSIVIDGDLDFRNEARISMGENPPDWVVSGRYPMGVALTLAPSFLTAHGLSLLLHEVTNAPAVVPNGFTIVYQVLNLGAIMAFWTMAMILLDRLLVRQFGLTGTSVCGGILLFWLGSYFFWFLVRSPFWAHTLSAAWLVVALVLFDRILRDLDRGVVSWRLPLLALVMSIAVLCRLSNVFTAPFALFLVIRLYQTGLLVRSLRYAPLVLAALAPIAVQLLIWQSSESDLVPTSPEAIGYEGFEQFFWTDPVLFLPLFSSLQGLFFWSPILLWSAWGIGWAVAKREVRRDPLFVCLMLSALVLWYVNGAWYAWWFGDGFGARAFLELAALFILGFALAIEHLRGVRRTTWRITITVIVAGLFVGYGLMFARAADLIPSPKDDFLFDWERRMFEHRRMRAFSNSSTLEELPYGTLEAQLTPFFPANSGC